MKIFLNTHKKFIKALSRAHTEMPAAPVRAQLSHLLNHSSEVRSSGFQMPKLLVTGETNKRLLQILEYHMLQLHSLRDLMEMLEGMERAQLFHPHNHSSEAKNNG